MNKIVQPQWLEWAKELQFIAQGGLTYSKDVFDIERFERIREIAAEMLSLQSGIPIDQVPFFSFTSSILSSLNIAARVSNLGV